MLIQASSLIGIHHFFSTLNIFQFLHVTRNPDSEASEEIAQPIPRLPIPMSSWSPLHTPSLYIPSDTGPSLAAATAGSKPEHLAFESAVDDYAGRDHAYHNHRWTFSAPACRYDPHVQWNSIGLPPSLSQSVNARDGTFGEPFPRFIGYGAIYTDDARMKLGDGVRRQCFNCRATETTTWRRSMLSSGKLVCLTWPSG